MADRFLQAGAVPYRRNAQTLDILLICTSSGRHWTIPKGIVDPGFSAVQTALNEAYEEAGIEGELALPPIGAYRFEKWGCIWKVTLYAMTVSRMLEHWPEDLTRRRIWIDYRQAAARVKHAGLKQVLLKLPERLQHPAV